MRYILTSQQILITDYTAKRSQYKMCYPFADVEEFHLGGVIRSGVSPYLENDLKRIKIPRLSSLFKRCWRFEPEKRPTMAEVVRELENVKVYAQQGDEVGVFTPSTTPSRVSLQVQES
jgi:hypothetical protein